MMGWILLRRMAAASTAAADPAWCGPRRLGVDRFERADLIAFLGTLTSEAEARPPAEIVSVASGPVGPAEVIHTSSLGRCASGFSRLPSSLWLKRGVRARPELLIFGRNSK
jgi:hypothetical protein